MMHALSGEEEKGGSSEGVADSSSIINGEQPSATTSTSSVADLRCALAAQGLDSRGTKKTIKRRLQKQRAKQQRGTAVKAVVQEEERDWRPKHDTYLVLDVEATCEGSKNGSFDYPNESESGESVRQQNTKGLTSKGKSHRDASCVAPVDRGIRALRSERYISYIRQTDLEAEIDNLLSAADGHQSGEELFPGCTGESTG